MKYELVVCEKPSVAASVASVLGAHKREGGFFEGGGHLVSWCYGHLVELAPPVAYGEHYRRWDRSALPIVPARWKYEAAPDKKKQLEILRSLMGRTDVTSVINACDAGREGELIFRLVYEYCGCNKPIKRLWISSMEDAAIREGFANLKDGATYDNLYCAALCRARADWLVGYNATRLFSCLYGATLNVGRVQSPTLAMIVLREAAVTAFVSEPFYTPVIDTGTFTAFGERLDASRDAEAVCDACNGTDATVLSVEKKERTEAAPRLYDLTALQRDANRTFGYTAQQTLDHTQALYEKKLATYPRTDSRYLTADMAAGLPGLVKRIAEKLPFARGELALCAEAVIDDTKVSDHHAILPTAAAADADWDSLPTGEGDILRLLALRLVCAVENAHQFETVTATLKCADQHFTAKGRTTLVDGWKAHDRAFRASVKEKADGEAEEDGALPELVEGQVFSAVAASVKEGKTAAPKRFTEDTLLAAMESAGAEDMPKDAERKGLGTPATRADVIEKLVKGGFVERKKKNLIPTKKGSDLISVLPDELTSALMTAEWEQQLLEIQRGGLADNTFMDNIASLVRRLVDTCNAPLAECANLFVSVPKGAMVGVCPRCKADVAESDRGFFCSSRTCRFALWKDARFWSAKGKKLDRKIVAALLKDGRIFFADLVSEKTKKTKKTYAATIVLTDDGEQTGFKLEFENERKAA
jgi:DNA topoisomerase-3